MTTSRLERIVTPYVSQRVFIASMKELRVAVSERVVTNGALANALQQALKHKRRFLLRPGLKDW